jgi:hypothetical protein
MPDVAFLKPSAAFIRFACDILEWISKRGGRLGRDFGDVDLCEREAKTAEAKDTCRAVGKNTIVFDVEVILGRGVGPVDRIGEEWVMSSWRRMWSTVGSAEANGVTMYVCGTIAQAGILRYVYGGFLTGNIPCSWVFTSSARSVDTK